MVKFILYWVSQVLTSIYLLFQSPEEASYSVAKGKVVTIYAPPQISHEHAQFPTQLPFAQNNTKPEVLQEKE